MIREIGLLAGWLTDKAFDAVAPIAPYLGAPVVPAGGVEAAATPPASGISTAGGHPYELDRTSVLLRVAADRLARDCDTWDGALISALRDRADQLAAHRD